VCQRKKEKIERPEKGGGEQMKKKIEEGGAVGMTIKTPGGNVKIRNFKNRVEGMDEKGNVISQGIYEIVINPEKYEYEADGARPVGVDFVEKLLANGEVIAND
jgi:hypothetical protein